MNFNDERPLFSRMAEALAERDEARAAVDNLRRLVAEGRAGAASLHAAEWVLACCQRRVDKLASQADHQPLDAA